MRKPNVQTFFDIVANNQGKRETKTTNKIQKLADLELETGFKSNLKLKI